MAIIKLLDNMSGSGAITGLSQTIEVPTANATSLTWRVSGTYVGVLVIEGTINGTDWVQSIGVHHGNGSVVNNFGFIFAATGTVTSPCAGFSAMRLNCISFTSGTAVVEYIVSVGRFTSHVFNGVASNLQAQVQGPGATGAAKVGNPIRVGAVYNAVLPTGASGQTLDSQSTPRGALHIAPHDSGGNEAASVPTALSNKIYCARATGVLAVSAVEAPAVLIRNPAGSGKRMRIQKIRSAIASTASQDVLFRLYFTPTVISNGTAVPINSTYVGGGAPASSMTIFSAPTLSAFGTGLDAWNAGSGVTGMPSVYSEFKDQLILAPGFDLSITGVPDGASRSWICSIWWLED